MSDGTDEARDQVSDPWSTHRDAQLDAWSATTPLERLLWLEEALAFAHRAGALRRSEPPPPTMR